MTTADGTTYGGSAVIEDDASTQIIDAVNLVFTSLRTFDGDMTRTVIIKSTGQGCKAYYKWHGTQP